MRNSTFQHLTVIALMSLSIATLSGCNDTAKGMAEDTKENTQAMGNATDNAGENLGNASQSAMAATLTTRIKSALIANPITNDPAVQINVESDKDKVRLVGHVGTAKQKNEAEELAKQILSDTQATQKLENELVLK